MAKIKSKVKKGLIM